MVVEYNLASQASILCNILLKGDNSEIINCADEILLFLNHLQDFIRQNTKLKRSFPAFNDILYGLESEPEAALQDNEVRNRLINLFVKSAKR